MNSVDNLAKKYLKASKSRNIFIIITIILTTCLLTSIGILSNSLRLAFLKNTTDYTGTAHGMYRFVDNKTAEAIRKHNKVDKAGEKINLGQVKDEEKTKISLSMAYVDKAYMDMNNIKLQEGNIPQKSDEVAVEKWVLEKLNLEPRLGQKISLEYVENSKGLNEEKIAYEGKGDFILSGILKDNHINKERKMSLAIVDKDYIESKVTEKNIQRDLYVRVKGDRKAVEDINEIAASFNLSYKQIRINEEYIKALSMNIEDLIPYLIVALVVVISAVIVIYNIFYISINSRINQFGLLSVIGATKKQIKKIVIKEGLMLSFIGIPGGLILGHLLSYLIFPLLKMNIEINISSSIYIILAATIVSLLTVIISLRKPSKAASKISPIEAVKYSGVEVNIKKLERKDSGKINLKKLAHLSFWRNKKRTVFTILSLTMSGMLFIIFASILSSMNTESLTRQYITSDFNLTSNLGSESNQGSHSLNKELVEKIKRLEGVKDISTLKFKMVYTENKELAAKYYPQGGDGKINCDLYGFDESLLKDLKKYVTEGELSIEELKNNNYVFVEDRRGESKYKIGDKIKLECRIPKSNSNNNGQGDLEVDIIEKEFIVKGKISENPNWLGWVNVGGTFITHEETLTRVFKEENLARVNINVKKGKEDSLEKEIKALAFDKDLIYNSFKDEREKHYKEQKGIEIIAYSLLIIIALIGTMNVINTMVTSILSRKKEFGLLQAVGLTNKQMTKVLQLEALKYSLISGTISIVLGTSLGYVLFTKFKVAATYAIYEFPIAPILIVAFGFTAIQVLITYLLKKKLSKDSIVDRIRYNQ